VRVFACWTVYFFVRMRASFANQRVLKTEGWGRQPLSFLLGAMVVFSPSLFFRLFTIVTRPARPANRTRQQRQKKEKEVKTVQQKEEAKAVHPPPPHFPDAHRRDKKKRKQFLSFLTLFFLLSLPRLFERTPLASMIVYSNTCRRGRRKKKVEILTKEPNKSHGIAGHNCTIPKQ
jgi:hypothetical protein